MSCPSPRKEHPTRDEVDEDNNNLISSNSSDYGSEFSPDETELLKDLLAQVDVGVGATTAPAATAATRVATPPQHSPAKTSTTSAIRDIEDCVVGDEDTSNGRVPRVLGRQIPPWQMPGTSRANKTYHIPGNGRPAFVEHPDSTEGRERQRERDVARERAWVGDVADATDSRTPVERFRRPPNKAFSVTDLVSPAWCEIQYWYTLTKFGRKRRTPAMKKGSTIHKTLEDEIYTTVPVEITTKEDALALRIWNVIQGLRTLREFGITRELEVWGMVDGELVNGVIDQLSYECPDSELEASAASHYAEVEATRAVMPEYQMSLTDYLLSPAQGGKKLSDLTRQHEPSQTREEPVSSSQSSAELFSLARIYMTDIKTRASSSVPTVKSSSFRPTMHQLQLYYHMLNRLAISDDVTIQTLASRYDLDPERSFTDAFITEVGSLNDQFFDALSSMDFDPDFIPDPKDAISRQPHLDSSQRSDNLDPSWNCPPTASQDSASVLLSHNTLTRLWKLMKDQLRLTFLAPATRSSHISVAPSIPSEFQPPTLEPYPTVLSPLLTARYISSVPTDDLDSRVLGSRSFLFDPTSLTSYLTDQMNWWRGQRSPRGVEVMEAWKCRICEFQDDCSWRQGREIAYARRRRKKSADLTT